MAQSMAGKVAIITGASRGIGRELALALARRGAAVTVAAKTAEATPGLPGTIHTVAAEVEECGGRALPVQCDVREGGDIAKMVAATVDTFGRVDYVVNNAGALWWQPIEATPMARFDLMHAINARASFALSQCVAPIMREQAFGHIVMQSPPIVLQGFAGKTAYLMSKYGMTMTALGIAEEYMGTGVAANSIWPATLIESQATINHRIGTPEQWRKADILTDAIMGIFSEDPRTFSGHQLIDESYLRTKGVTDFSKYQCVPGSEPPRLADLQDTLSAGRARDAQRKQR